MPLDRRVTLADRLPPRYLGAVTDKHPAIQLIEAARRLSDSERGEVLEFINPLD